MLSARQQAHENTHTTESIFGKSLLLFIPGLIRISLGIIFVWSGMTKFLAPQHFSTIIESYGLIPDLWVPAAALCLSVVEVLAGVGLIIDLQGALGIVTVLLVFFMVILSYGLWMGLDVDCGCFGPEDPEAKAYQSLRPALYRDWVMLAAAVSLFGFRRQRGIYPLKLSTLYNRYIEKGDET